MDEIAQALSALRTMHPEVELALAVQSPSLGLRRLETADLPMHAASTMKLAVLLSLYRAADDEAQLERELPLRNTFTSVYDGSSYGLRAEDDSDPGLYARLGQRITRRELARRMIVRSSNLATNLLIEDLGVPRIAADLQALGIEGLRVLRGVEDGPAFRAGLINTTTARALLDLLVALATGRAAGPTATAEMLDVLAAQELTDMIGQALPTARVLSKSGRIRGIEHDAALVFGAGIEPYALVILTRGFPDAASALSAGRTLARAADAWIRNASPRPPGG